MLLLSLIVMYFRWTPSRSVAFFMQPMIVVLLGLGIVLAAIHQGRGGESQNFLNAWTFIHLIAIITATLCFVFACVGGILYLLADRQRAARASTPLTAGSGCPLASIEKLSRWMIVVGFPLLSLATIAGILRMTQSHQPSGSLYVKIALGMASWACAYALLPMCR